MTDDNTLHGFGLEQARDINRATQLVLGTASGGRSGAPVIQTAAAPIVVELIGDLPADDYKQHDARQVIWNGSDWVAVSSTPVKVRKITAAAIEAGSDDDPTRLRARPVANLGLCVGEPAGSGDGDTATTISTTTCCGCGGDSSFTTYNGDPLNRSVSGVTYDCCEIGGAVLRRSPIDSDNWTASNVLCKAEGEAPQYSTEWVLTPAGVLTVTHETLGLIARYERADDSPTDNFCSQRFVLDETTTPMNSRNCAACTREVCVGPFSVTLVTDCFVDSPHGDTLPAFWLFTEEDIDSGSPFYDDSGVLEWETSPFNCQWNFADCHAGEYTLNYCPTTGMWRVWYTTTVGFGCGSPGNIDFRPPCGTTYEPTVEWHDDDWDGRQISKVVSHAGGGTWRFTLEAL